MAKDDGREYVGEDGREYVTQTMDVTRLKDSRLADSRKKPGDFSPLTLSDGNDRGQVTLSFIDDEGTPEPEKVYIYEKAELPRRSKEQEEFDEFVWKFDRALDVAIEYGPIAKRLLIEYGPIAKRLWIEKVNPAAIQAWNELSRARRALSSQRGAEKKNAVIETRVVEPSSDIAAVAQESKTSMTSSEARDRRRIALAAQSFADDELRLLDGADIRDDEGFRELEHAPSELPPEQVAKILQRFEAEPTLLADDALTGPDLILGVERADGPLPLEERRQS